MQVCSVNAQCNHGLGKHIDRLIPLGVGLKVQAAEKHGCLGNRH